MFLKKYYLEITVFMCGAVVMILELVGSRVLAPHVGTSIVVWTSLIGIILASLSAGYYWGGARADRSARPQDLARLIFWAAVGIMLTAIFENFVLITLRAIHTDVRWVAIAATTILFAPTSVLLGMVSPYAAKLKLQNVATAGATVGTLYALSTIGSIVGTFLAGFFLISYLGNTNILYLLTFLLLATSWLVYPTGRPWRHVLLLVVILICVGVSAYAQSIGRRLGFIDVDTHYQRVQIFTSQPDSTGRRIRTLRTDAFGTQSGRYLDSDELLFEYTKMYNLAAHFQPNLQHTLMIGGGAYSYPRAFIKKFPTAQIDVVEIDPKLTELSREYFGLKDDPRLHIFHEDGRMFINRLPRSYDAVFIDAFHSLTPPFQLTTKEVAEKLFAGLSENGVVLMNLISAVEGDAGAFLQAEYATYKSVFPYVAIFPIVEPERGDRVQNIMLIASKSRETPKWESADPKLTTQLSKRWHREIATRPILTDEYAPVDQYQLALYR